MAADGEGNPKVWPREEETRNYLEEHRIFELFNNLTSQLMFSRPEEPKRYMIDTLEKLQKAKTTQVDYPCLFNETNIQSVFGMLDPTNRGYITMKQYNEGLKTLGVTNFTTNPDGEDDNKIIFDIFLTEARDGLHRASATFRDS